jgi:hypothetical protein
MPRTTPDRITVARLHGAASRYAGWTRPEGEAREHAVTVLREIATEESPHRAPRLRTDLLAEAAGVLIGAASPTHPEHHLIAAELLIGAGADEDLVEKWIPVGRERAEPARPFRRDEAPTDPSQLRWAVPPRDEPS